MEEPRLAFDRARDESLSWRGRRCWGRVTDVAKGKLNQAKGKAQKGVGEANGNIKLRAKGSGEP